VTLDCLLLTSCNQASGAEFVTQPGVVVSDSNRNMIQKCAMNPSNYAQGQT
jgi:hypothetical protein